MENVVHVRRGQGQGQGLTKRQGHMLCLNAGSSSLKLKLFDTAAISSSEPERELDALISGSIKLKGDHAKVELTHHNGQSHSETKDWDNIASSEVLSYLLSTLSRLVGADDKLDVKTVVHRVVHGAHLEQCVSITRSDQHHLKTLQFLAEFAPLHNAVSVQLIRQCLASSDLPKDHQNVCCFDTAFHSSMDPARSRYMVDPNLAGTALPGGMELRKWGFHGLSYGSILNTLSKSKNMERSKLNVIICHLGSGSSMCAVVGGKSFDTTMGLTPLEGLPGATRSGSVDPVLPLHISASQLGKQGQQTQDPFSTVEVADGIRVSHAELVLNKHSGFSAVAGTNDFEQVAKRRTEFLRGKTMNKEENERELDRGATLAFDMFVDRIVGFLGSYAAKMSSRGGVGAVVFSGGIGEASNELRAELARLLEHSPLSPAITETDTNTQEGDNQKCWQLSREALSLGTTTKTVAMGQCVPWFVCKTDEEGEMARQVLIASSK